MNPLLSWARPCPIFQGWLSSGPSLRYLHHFLTGLFSLLSKGLSRVFSSTTIQKHQFFGTLCIKRQNNRKGMISMSTRLETQQLNCKLLCGQSKTWLLRKTVTTTVLVLPGWPRAASVNGTGEGERNQKSSLNSTCPSEPSQVYALWPHTFTPRLRLHPGFPASSQHQGGQESILQWPQLLRFLAHIATVPAW